MSDFQKEYYYRIVQAIIAIVLAGVKDYIFWLAPRALSYCNRASFTYSLCFGEPRKKNTGEKTRRQQQDRTNTILNVCCLIEVTMAEIPGITTTPSGRLLNISTARPADSEKDVFIPLDETVRKLKNILNAAWKKGDHVTFFRAPVAAGKSTLVQYLSTAYNEEFVKVDFAVNEDMWFRHIIDASGKDLPLDSVMKALDEIGKQGKAIVIDEAHLLFGCPRVVALLTKGLQGKNHTPKIVLFSASGSAVGLNGETVATPSEITHKYMWYPPVPDSERLVEELKEAEPPIHLTADSVRFFIALCGGHRGIFMRSMTWVQECQNISQDGNDADDDNNITSWNIQECVSQVRKTFEESRKATTRGLGWNIGLRKAFKASRAVRVNGNFSNIENIPKEFGMVLFGGSKLMKELNGKERDLTINGFLFPERTNSDEEFVLYDWTDIQVCYGISNPIMAEYYSDVLSSYKRRLVESKKKPSSAADLLARVLPYMTFTTVVDNPIPTREGGLTNPLSREGLPYEDDYNDAIALILEKDLKYIVSRPKNPNTGKTDVVVTYDDNCTCAIESIMAWQTLVSFSVCCMYGCA